MPQDTNSVKDFERVYKQYYTTMFYKALDWTLDEELAKDLVEDLFVDLWQRFDTIRIDEVSGWLNTTIRNKAINHYRHQKVEQKYEEEYLSVTSEIMDEEDGMHEERLKAIEMVIEEQPPQRKFIFDQCCLKGKTYKEVSEIVGIEITTVHKHVSKVYAALRIKLKGKN